MDDRRLMYFKDPLVKETRPPLHLLPFVLTVHSVHSAFLSLLLSQDAYARGEVFIGSKENSYTVLSGLPSSIQGYHWNHGITIVTPDRKFLFACETEAEQRDWISAFQRVINRPMRPQEYAGTYCANCVRPYGVKTDLSFCMTSLCFFFAVEAHFKHKP